ncbi:MAG: hypothetical protein Kow0069_26550 [Promethearchaeota archaeon]
MASRAVNANARLRFAPVRVSTTYRFFPCKSNLFKDPRTLFAAALTSGAEALRHTTRGTSGEISFRFFNKAKSSARDSSAATHLAGSPGQKKTTASPSPLVTIFRRTPRPFGPPGTTKHLNCTWGACFTKPSKILLERGAGPPGTSGTTDVVTSRGRLTFSWSQRLASDLPEDSGAQNNTENNNFPSAVVSGMSFMVPSDPFL